MLHGMKGIVARWVSQHVHGTIDVSHLFRKIVWEYVASVAIEGFHIWPHKTQSVHSAV